MCGKSNPKSDRKEDNLAFFYKTDIETDEFHVHLFK